MKNIIHECVVYEISKFTTLDFKDHLACILWFAKCNMRCPYCYNLAIVEGEGRISNAEILEFLATRTKRLDGVVLSGGECTMYSHLVELCTYIKELGFQIKIDTNGSNPQMLKELISKSLVDFIALDYKAPPRKWRAITHLRSSQAFYESLDMLISEDFPFEVRTTLHPDLLEPKDINTISADLHKRAYKGIYYIQNYLHVEQTLGNMSVPQKRFDKNLLSKSVPIEFRNKA